MKKVKVVVVDPDGNTWPLLPVSSRSMKRLQQKPLVLRTRPWYYNTEDLDEVWPPKQDGFTIEARVG